MSAEKSFWKRTAFPTILGIAIILFIIYHVFFPPTVTITDSQMKQIAAAVNTELIRKEKARALARANKLLRKLGNVSNEVERLKSENRKLKDKITILKENLVWSKKEAGDNKLGLEKKSQKNTSKQQVKPLKKNQQKPKQKANPKRKPRKPAKKLKKPRKKTRKKVLKKRKRRRKSKDPYANW